MHQLFAVDVDASPERVFPLVADLERYEELLDIVHRVQPAGAEETAGESPAWLVTLRARVGPLARSKRLRMERTVHDPLSTVRFERVELDGRDHSPWILDAHLEPAGDGGSRVEMKLDYRGGLWSGVLGVVLENEVATARTNLEALASR